MKSKFEKRHLQELEREFIRSLAMIQKLKRHRWYWFILGVILTSIIAGFIY